jgi:hypothetical protein
MMMEIYFRNHLQTNWAGTILLENRNLATLQSPLMGQHYPRVASYQKQTMTGLRLQTWLRCHPKDSLLERNQEEMNLWLQMDWPLDLNQGEMNPWLQMDWLLDLNQEATNPWLQMDWLLDRNQEEMNLWLQMDWLQDHRRPHLHRKRSHHHHPRRACRAVLHLQRRKMVVHPWARQSFESPPTLWRLRALFQTGPPVPMTPTGLQISHHY